jgi:hypothetical protein
MTRYKNPRNKTKAEEMAIKFLEEALSVLSIIFFK